VANEPARPAAVPDPAGAPQSAGAAQSADVTGRAGEPVPVDEPGGRRAAGSESSS